MKSNYPWSNPIEETSWYNIYEDKYPVTEGHLLFIPKEEDEYILNKCFLGAYRRGEEWVQSGFCEGFNIGMNKGEWAGQTVMYPHVHLIPRREGDLGWYENGTPYDPQGGVSNVIPHKGKYK